LVLLSKQSPYPRSGNPRMWAHNLKQSEEIV
jgi:hypothetical protein